MRDHDHGVAMVLAALSVAEGLVTLATLGRVRPWWYAKYWERYIRRIALERSAKKREPT